MVVAEEDRSETVEVAPSCGGDETLQAGRHSLQGDGDRAAPAPGLTAAGSPGPTRAPWSHPGLAQ